MEILLTDRNTIMEQVKGLRYKRTLFVGLGGAGARTLRTLKKKILAANSGELPKQIKFLLIDTNATELSNYRDFDSSEKICIAVREPYQRYKHDLGSATHEFIPPQNTAFLQALERGAGQIRSNGHFAVIENQYSNKLRRIFRETADQLEDIDIDGKRLERDPKVEVRLVFSIAGGTGSGVFLPIATLLRSAIKHSELTAYIYSATHYSKQVENSAKYAVMQNAYTALCELDYMMHFGRDKRREDIRFNFGPEVTQSIVQTNKPFEEVYYIDKHTSYPAADSVEFSYNEISRLQENTAEVMHISATNIITAHTGTVDNVRQKIMEGQFDVSDKFAWVSGVGIAELFFNKLDINNPQVVEACYNAVDARVDSEGKQKDLDYEDEDKIAQSLISLRYDESKGPLDKDPILKKFGNQEMLKTECDEVIDKILDDTRLVSELNYTIDDILVKKDRKSDEIIKDVVDDFGNELDILIRKLIDDDKDYKNDKVKGYDSKGGGMSLKIVRTILKRVDAKLDASVKTITEEQNDHKSLFDNEEKRLNVLISQINVAPGGQNGQGQIGNGGNAVVGLSAQIRTAQKKGLYNLVLSQRDGKTLDVLNGCKEKVDEAITMLNDWEHILNDANSFGQTKKNPSNSQSDNVIAKSNRVEVQMVDCENGLRLKYENIKEVVARSQSGEYQSNRDKFDAICRLLVKEAGSLHKYLVKGIEKIKNLSEDGRVRVERTECQQKIDRLIDLSTPTMQVDTHGYGDRVKEDHFWYIMTDCPEANVAEKPRTTGKEEDRNKSVGRLLKDLIEQNTLDAKINLVHVPGWNDKAIVYRVDSAIPAYFVEGVCVSTNNDNSLNGCEDGYTLEGCYEELKKTRQSYTPFSHEKLREILENKICALKPLDEIENDKVLDLWLNFLILNYIRVDRVDGTYCIESPVCGQRLTDQLECRKNILILGTTRSEAFETFQRYCGELLKEKKDYQDAIKKPVPMSESDKKGKNINAIHSCDYIANEYLCKYKETDIEKLTKEDDDFKLLDREMKQLDKRFEVYDKMKKEKERNERLSGCDDSALKEYCKKLKEQKQETK